MSSFDATSGIIDALFGVAIYAGLIFGIRSLVHRMRKTESNPANNKWLGLSVIGLAALVFVAGGATSNEATITPIDPRTDRCTQAQTAFDNLAAQMPGASAVSYQDNQTKRNIMRQASYLVVGSPNCFPPGDVARAQSILDQMR